MINISHRRLRLFFFILFCSFLLSSSQSIIDDISINAEQKFVTKEGASPQYFKGKIAEKNYQFVKFKTINLAEGGYAHVFVSNKTEKPTFADSDEKSLLPSSLLYIPVEMFSQDNTMKIGVECLGSCNYRLEYSLVNEIQLEDDATIDVKIEDKKEKQIIYKVVDGLNKKILLTVTNGGNGWFNVELDYGGRPISFWRTLYNGFGGVIGADDYETFEPGTPLVIKISATSYGDVFTVTSRLMEVDTLAKPTVIAPMDVMLSIVGDSDVEKECYKIKNSRQSESYNYNLYAYSFPQNAYIYTYDSATGEKGAGKRVEDTAYMTITANANTLVCFEVDEGSKEEGYEIASSLQFQIVDTDNLEPSLPYTMPLIRGVPFRGVAKAGELYHYHVFSYFFDATQLTFQLHKSKGNPILYVGQCQTYPDCTYDPNQLEQYVKDEKLYTSPDVNDNYFLAFDVTNEQTYKSSNPYLAVVYCQGTVDCEFVLTITNEDEAFFLLNDIRMSTPIPEDSVDLYSFVINSQLPKQLYVGLYSYSGNADFILSRNKDSWEEVSTKEVGQYEAAGNKEFYVLYNLNEPEEKNNTLRGIYYIKVTATANSYYSIYYYYLNEFGEKIYLPSGELQMEIITNFTDNQVFAFKNRNIEQESAFFITTLALNCDLKFTFMDKEYETRENTFKIAKGDEGYDSGVYDLTVEFIKHDAGTDEDIPCMIYLVGNEDDESTKEVVLNEGVSHTMFLDDTFKTVSYLYPYYPKFDSDETENIVISVNKISEGDLDLRYQLNFGPVTTVRVANYNRQVVISGKDIATYCQDELCRIRIQVTMANPSIKGQVIEYDIIAFGVNSIPIYLTRGEYRLDVVKKDKYQYYITEIGNEYSEAVVNFKKGNGFAIAKIFNRDPEEGEVTNPDYLRKYKLPKVEDEDAIPMDYYNKKFVFDESMTSHCEVKGCVIIIGVGTLQDSENANNEYAIYYRTDDTMVDLPDNEYAFGSLSVNTEEVEHDFYTSIIQKDSDRVIVNLDTDNSNLYITVNKEGKPSASNADFVLTSTNSFLELKETDSKLEGKSLKGSVLRFGVGPSDDSKKYFDTYYNFKVITPERDLPTIVTADTSQNEECYVSKDGNKCYFIVPVYKYNSLTYLYFHGYNEKDTSAKITFYINVVDMEMYDKLTNKDEIKKLIPTETSYNMTSATRFDSDSILINVDGKNNDLYVLVTVKSSKSGKINFLTSYYLPPESYTMRPNSDELFYLQPGANTSMIVFGEDLYYVEVVLVEGVGVAAINNLQYALLTDEGSKSVAFIVQPIKNDTQLSLSATPYTPFAFFVRYKKRTSDENDNLDQIQYANTHYIKYTNNFFPISYYMPVDLADKDITDINVNVRIALLEKSTSSDEDSFVFEGYLVDGDFIRERKKSKEAELPSSAVQASCVYDPATRIGQAIFKAEEIKGMSSDKKRYLYVILKQDKDNQNTYDFVNTKVTTMPVRAATIDSEIPRNEYYFGSIPDTLSSQKVTLRKGHEEDQVLDIEFSSSVAMKVQLAYSDGTEIAKTNEKFMNGKYQYSIDVSKKEGVIMTITKTNGSVLPNYILRYLSSVNTIAHFKVNDPNIWMTAKENGQISGVIRPLVGPQGLVERNTIYTVSLYDKQGYTLKYFDKIPIDEAPVYSVQINGDPKKNQVRFVIKCDITKDYYLTIHATVFDDEKIETLGYTPIDTKDPPKPTERQKITITKESGNIFPQTIQPQIYIDATITLPNDNAEEYKYVKLSIENHESGNYAHIFVSPTEEKPNYANSIDKSLDKSSILWIKTEDLPEKKMTIGTECKGVCSYTLTYQLMKEITIEDNSSIDILIHNAETKTLVYPIEDGEFKKILLAVQAAGNYPFNVSVTYNGKNVDFVQKFFNGYGAILDATDYEYVEGTPLIISITAHDFYGDQFTITSRLLDDDSLMNPTPISVNDVVLGLVGDSGITYECYQLINPRELEDDNADIFNYTLYAYAFTQNAYIFVYDTNSQNVTSGYFIKDTGYVSFQIERNTHENNLICFAVSSNLDEPSSIQFQVLDTEKYYEAQPYTMPLIRGIPLRATLKRNEALQYHVYTNYEKAEQLTVQLHKSKGNAVLYLGQCADYPNCRFKEDEIKSYSKNGTLNTVQDLNDNYWMAVPITQEHGYKKPKQFVAVVQCEDDECIYEITMSNENEQFTLLNDIRMSSPLPNATDDTYHFRINDEKMQDLYVGLYCYSGKATMEFYRRKESGWVKEGFVHGVGNKEFVTMQNQNNETEPSTLLGEYKVVVSAQANSYYNVYYYAKQTFGATVFIPSGEEVMQTITKWDEKNSFFLKNRNREDSTGYFLTLLSLNCDLKFTFNDKYTSTKRETIFKLLKEEDESTYMQSQYTLDVEFIAHDSNATSDDEECMFYIVGKEDMLDKEVVINEGVSHTMRLDKDFDEVTYVYPYFPKVEESAPENIVLSINKINEGKLYVNYTLNSGQKKTVPVYTYNRQIVISTEDIQQDCNETLCRIAITVELRNPMEVEEVEYDILIFSVNSVPIYLTRGEYRLDNVKKGHYQYYLTETGNMYSEAVINFKKGTGFAVASIQPKLDDTQTVPDADYLHKYKLPKFGDEDVIPFDYYNKKFVFDENDMTKKCKEKGCFIFIGVMTYQESERANNEFSIFYRVDDTIVDLPENEYAFGSLKKDDIENEKDYFSIVIQKDTDRVIIPFDTENCNLYVIVGELTKPTSTHYQYMADINNPILELKSNSTFKGVTISFGIQNKNTNDNFYSYYNLKVVVPDKGIHTIITADTSQNEQCYIGTDGGHCYFLIPMYHYTGLTYVATHGYNMNDLSAQIFFDANAISMEEYENLAPEEKQKAFPLENSKEPDASSRQQFDTDNLMFKLDSETKDDMYVLVTVTSSKKGRISFLTAFYAPLGVLTLRPNSEELFYLQSTNSTTIVIKGSQSYSVEFILVEGYGMVSFNDTQNVTLTDESAKQVAFVLNNEKGEGYFTVEAPADDIFFFFVRYKFRAITVDENIDEIQYSNTHYIKYTANRFPISYYMPIIQNTTATAISLRFTTLEHSDTQPNEEKFIFDSGIVNYEFIKSKKIVSATVIPTGSQKASSITYNQGTRLAKFIFEAKNMTIGNYLFVTIKPDNQVYSQVATKVTALPIGDEKISVTIPKNEYYTSTMPSTLTKQTLMLRKGVEEDTTMDIEYAQSEDLQITINYQGATELDKNATFTTVYQNGKFIYTIDVNGTTTKEVLFTIFNKKTNLRTDNNATEPEYIIQYKTSQNKINHYQISGNFKFNKTSNYFNGHFNSVKDSNNAVHANTLYTVSLFAYEKGKDLTLYNKLHISETPITTLLIKGTSDETTQFSFGDGYDKDYYIVSVQANAMEGEASELLVYPAAVTTNSPDTPGEGGNNNIWKYIIIGGSIVLVALLLVGLFLLKKSRKHRGNGTLEKEYKKIQELDNNELTY